MEATLAEVDLSGSPVGRIFDSGDPDNTIEERYFANWQLPLTPHKYWQRPSPFILDEEEDGSTVLECERQCEAAMVTGDPDWADYTVESRVRVITEGARAGVVARYRTSRHYYLFAVELPGKAVLYCRDNNDWGVLAEAPLELDRRRYYRLELTVEGGRLSASHDGVESFQVTDERYRTGLAGIRSQGRVRFGGVRVTAGPGEEDALKQRRADRLKRETDVQAQYPQEELVARYPKPDWPHEMSQMCRVGPGGAWGLLIYNSDSVFSAAFAARYCSGRPTRLGIADLEGNLLWGREMAIRFPYPIDVNGDGRDEILGILDGERIAVLSCEDGSVLCETALPESCPYQGHRGQPIAPDLVPWCRADLRGNGTQQDFVIKDDRESRGGRTLWAYDGQLNSLWTARVGHPRYGHVVSACDANGDGRDEVLAGFHLFEADGNLMWKCRQAEMNGDDHVDEVRLGLFGPNGEPRACGTNGEDGFFILDGASGEVIASHHAGHVQGCSVGNYLHDRPGMDYCVGTRWGNYGVLSTLDTEGNLVKMWQPDNVSQGGPRVRWTGDGRDFFFLQTTEEAFGLWDGYGNRCVALKCPELPSKGFYGIQTCQTTVLDVDDDEQDELVFMFPSETFVYKSS